MGSSNPAHSSLLSAQPCGCMQDPGSRVGHKASTGPKSIPMNGRSSSGVLQNQVDHGLFSFDPHPDLWQGWNACGVCALHSKKNYLLTIFKKPLAFYFSKCNDKAQFWKTKRQSCPTFTVRTSVAWRD